MAILRSLAPSTQNVKAHTSWVDCEFAVVNNAQNEPMVHLSTFGSDSRISNRKSSQSMQVDRVIAEQLVEMLTDVFHLQPKNPAPMPAPPKQSDAPSLRHLLDVSPSSGSESEFHPMTEALMDAPRFVDQYTRLNPRLSPRSVALVLTDLLQSGNRISHVRLAELLGMRASRARQSAAVLIQVINGDGVEILSLEDRTISLSQRRLAEHYGLT